MNRSVHTVHANLRSPGPHKPFSVFPSAGPPRPYLLLQRLPVLGKVLRCLWRSHHHHAGAVSRLSACFSRFVLPESFLPVFLPIRLLDEPGLRRGVARGALGSQHPRLRHPGTVPAPAPIHGGAAAPEPSSARRAQVPPDPNSPAAGTAAAREPGSRPARVSARERRSPEVPFSPRPAGNRAFASGSARPGAGRGSLAPKEKGCHPGERRPRSAAQDRVGVSPGSPRGPAWGRETWAPEGNWGGRRRCNTAARPAEGGAGGRQGALDGRVWERRVRSGRAGTPGSCLPPRGPSRAHLPYAAGKVRPRDGREDPRSHSLLSQGRSSAASDNNDKPCNKCCTVLFCVTTMVTSHLHTMPWLWISDTGEASTSPKLPSQALYVRGGLQENTDDKSTILDSSNCNEDDEVRYCGTDLRRSKTTQQNAGCPEK